MLQVAQAAVNDARGAAGYAAGKIVLLDQQRVLSRARALARHCHAIDAAANHHYVKALAFQACPWICR